MKDIPGYEGLYTINENGEVFSLERIVTRIDGKVKRFKKHKLIPNIKLGYKSVTLSKNGKPHSVFVHRALALAFLPNPNKLPQVHHKDNDKMNNSLDNLMWVTRKQNIQEFIKIGRSPNPRWNLVLCLRTGIYYQSAAQAFAARNIKPTPKQYFHLHDLQYCENTVD